MHRLRKLTKLLARDEGISLVEVSTAAALLGVVVAALFAVLHMSQDQLALQVSRADSNDQVRLAMQTIDRDVRSGDVLYDPSDESYAGGDIVPGMSMRIYTESNQPTHGKRCVQWRVTSAGELQQRKWSPVDPAGTVTGWRIAATGIMNRADGVTAFSRPTPGTRNVVNVALRANSDPNKGRTVEINASASGRNTTFFTASEPCGPSSPAPVAGPDGIPNY